MKKIILFSTLSALYLALPLVALAKEKKEKPTDSPTVEASVSPTATPEPAPRWVAPPPVSDDDRYMKYRLTCFSANDANGANASTFADIIFRRRLDQYDTSAEGDIRVGKTFSSSDTGNTLELHTGKISYTAPFLTCTVGRMDFGSALSPMAFFGNYSTQGIVRADGIQLTLPIAFSLGVQDLEKVESKSTALSFFYFPSLLSAQYASIDTTQAFVMGQIRVAANIEGMPLIVRINAGQSANTYFTDSALSGNLALDGSVDLALDHDVSAYANFGVQNVNAFSNTDVLAAGVKTQHIYTFGPFSFDEVSLEVQEPLFSTTDNVFAGGNNFNPALATLPQASFFGQLKARISAINLLFSITNSPGDFTFARVNPTNSAVVSSFPLGTGNQLPYLGVPLVAPNYSTFSWNAAVGVEF